MAKLLLMTERNVSGLAQRGVIPKSERGRYELVPVVQAYIRYLRDRTIGGDMTGDENLANAKGRMVKARARMAEAEADLLDGTRAAAGRGGGGMGASACRAAHAHPGTARQGCARDARGANFGRGICGSDDGGS